MVRRKLGLMRQGGVGAMALALACGVMPVLAPARAADIDYGKLVQERVLKCLHPTAHADTSRVEVVKGREVNGEVSTVRLKIYYSGWLKKHSMEVELMIREAGAIRQMKVNVLDDTGTEVAKCDLTKSWADF